MTTRRSLALALTLLTALATVPAGAPAQQPFKFSLNFIPYGVHIGYYVAKDKGWYREAGLDVEILKGDGSADAVRRLGTGAVDMAMADMSTQIAGRARGLKIRAVGIILDRDPSVMLSLKSTGIQKPKDMEGKLVGALTASALRDTWPAVAAANGVDPAKVTWVDMPGSAYVASLMSKKVHAIATYVTTLPGYEIQAKRLGEEVAVLSFADFGVDTYAAGIMATDQLIQEQPDRVRRFVHASLRGYAWAFEHPDEAVKIFQKTHPEANPARVRQEIKITADLMLTPVAMREGIGTYAEDKVQRTRDFALKPRGTDPATIPVKDIYTNEFVPKLFPKPRF
jgi:NitT/TauT family transport system substrate-binding protein